MNLSRHFYPVAGMLAILTAASLSSTHVHTVAYGSNTQPVLVTNTASSPVPTAAQGTTQVGGTVGLASGTSVGVSSLPAVQIASGQSVGISGSVSLSNTTNTPLPTVDQNVAKRVPVSATLAIMTFPDGQPFASVTNNGFDFNGYTVPAGYKLVIQYVFGNANLPVGERLTDVEETVPFTMPDRGPDYANIAETFNGGETVLKYIPANSTIFGSAARSSTSGVGRIELDFEGYLEPA